MYTSNDNKDIDRLYTRFVIRLVLYGIVFPLILAGLAYTAWLLLKICT